MIPFVGPSYELAARKASVQRAVNLYLAGMEAAGKSEIIMTSIPGLTLFSTPGGSSVRGMLVAAGRLFVVAGANLYEISSAGVATARGTLSTSTGVVSMAYGTTQLVLVDGPYGYVFTLATNAFNQITSAGFYGSARVRFIDNYFVFVKPNSQQFYISAINDATTFDPLDFASAESFPDGLVSLEVSHSELWLMGDLSIEVWFDSGGADFPFARNKGASIEVGCQAAQSVQKMDNSVFWIGKDANGSGIVYRSQGYLPLRISTQAIEQALQASTDLSSATAYTYQDKGLSFYCINAPGLTATWCYEVSTGSWHERCEIDPNGQYMPHRAVCYAFPYGKRLVGGSDGKVYILDPNVYTLAGAPLVRERTSPHEAQTGRLIQFFSAFYLDCTTGEAALGVDAQVQLSWSKDSGATWSNSITRSAGKTGETFPRLLWTLLGRARDRIWRVKFDGNAPFSIIDGGGDSTPGVN